MVVTGVVIGAGSRGRAFSRYATEEPDKFQIVAVAEPRDSARQWMQKKFNISEERCFVDFETASKLPKFADCALICTQDRDHIGAALAMADKGYHILLEKPMAVSAEECRQIYATCKRNNIILSVCHVLRYHPSVLKLKELILSGCIGDVVNINHVEPVGFFHFAHSFVRGNWRNESQSSFSLLTKACHDVDIIRFLMGEEKQCEMTSSFGTLKHFTRTNKPKDASSRCLECPCEENCCYSAKKIYLDVNAMEPGGLVDAVCDLEDIREEVGYSTKEYRNRMTKAISEGPYGRCVYDCDNDVCDNQVVNFKFSGGATATLTMIAYSMAMCCRKTTISGTKGELVWDDYTSQKYSVDHIDFLTGRTQTHQSTEKVPSRLWGHGGSDYFLIKSFVEAVANSDPSLIRTGPEESLRSHLLTFAAEESRVSERIIKPSEDSRFSFNDNQQRQST